MTREKGCGAGYSESGGDEGSIVASQEKVRRGLSKSFKFFVR